MLFTTAPCQTMSDTYHGPKLCPANSARAHGDAMAEIQPSVEPAGQGGAYHFCSGSAPPAIEAIRTAVYDTRHSAASVGGCADHQRLKD
eukprot:Skav212668  [mRNA]  locus=scaffold1227:601938:602993:+ [translate_table: standard]